MIGLKRTTDAAVEPISLQEAKEHLRITTTDEDILIFNLIKAARQRCEDIQQRSYIDQIWTLKTNEFPPDSTSPIELPRPPLLDSTNPTINYTDTDGNAQSLTITTDFFVEESTFVGQLHPAYNTTWPAARDIAESVVIVYHAGYGATSADVPETIRTAILHLVWHWFSYRGLAEDVKVMPVPEMVIDLLWTERVLSI